ncbi:MAG TPA: hypothetical protein VHY35_23060, partial [Stellaceae bacterium]|nr:hypothetical protein [Stellaceae bacterium]
MKISLATAEIRARAGSDRDQNPAPALCFDAFSSREPEPTSLENAKRTLLLFSFAVRQICYS